jgi:Mg2+-importing ATPase
MEKIDIKPVRPGPARPEAFWWQPTAALMLSLHSAAAGLSTADASGRRARVGPNVFRAVAGQSLLARLARRVFNPLIAVLIVAAAISGLSGDMGSFGIIVVVVSLSITLDIVQEHRAEQAADALRRSVAVKADVRRDGAVKAIPVEELVPGDIVELRAGDLVPADGVVVEAHNAQVNQAVMTGESFPATKSEGASDGTAPADAANALFAGTSVVGGSIVMLVVETGARTRFGGIAAALAAEEPPTALEQGVKHLGLLILQLTVFLVLFVLLVHLTAGRAPVDSFLFAVALAVGLTPELLPMVMTVTLARGAQRMARRKVIVKRLSSIHDFGAMDVLCVDKTGTLTEAKVKLDDVIDINGHHSDEALGFARLNSALQTGLRSPLDEAILAAAPTALDQSARIAEVPFDFERRCVSVLVEHDGRKILITKGAPEHVLERAATVQLDGGPEPVAAWSAKFETLLADYGKQGFRLLAVATKDMPPTVATATVEDETGLTIIGFCVFSDPPKTDAARAVKELRELGIRLKIISGDQPAVVQHVAAAVGITGERIMTGGEIAEATSGLATGIDGVDLFARVDPDQKTRIINALRRRGHVVGFMGDGVNDAPAIRAAHVGLSVDGATDVARAAADMILLAPDLGVLAQGVREGRRTFANILKYVRMGTSSNFGNMLSMALASLVLPFLPLLPIQILLNNLLYDLSEVGIPFDDVDADDVREPHGWSMRDILRFTVVMGVVSSLFDATTFAVLIKLFDADAATFQTAWFVESIATQILVIFLIRSRKGILASRPNVILVLTSLGALAVAIGLVLVPLRKWFGFVAIDARLGLTIAVIVAGYLVSAEFAKRFVVGRPRGG